MTEPTITIVGNVAADPESRAAGTIASFRVACTQRRFDKDSNRWIDAHTSWYQVSAFRQLGAHALQSLRKGERVIVTGRLRIRDWQSTSSHGTSADIDADAIGHDLLFGTTAFRRAGGSESASTSSPPAEWPVTTLPDLSVDQRGDEWSPPMTTADAPPQTPTEGRVDERLVLADSTPF